MGTCPCIKRGRCRLEPVPPPSVLCTRRWLRCCESASQHFLGRSQWTHLSLSQAAQDWECERRGGEWKERQPDLQASSFDGQTVNTITIHTHITPYTQTPTPTHPHMYMHIYTSHIPSNTHSVRIKHTCTLTSLVQWVHEGSPLCPLDSCPKLYNWANTIDYILSHITLIYNSIWAMYVAFLHAHTHTHTHTSSCKAVKLTTQQHAITYAPLHP